MGRQGIIVRRLHLDNVWPPEDIIQMIQNIEKRGKHFGNPNLSHSTDWLVIRLYYYTNSLRPNMAMCYFSSSFNKVRKNM